MLGLPSASAELLIPAASLRKQCREGAFSGSTSGLAPGYAQANIVILPVEAAFEFIRFCQRNPKPCPLLAVSEPGDPALPTLGADIDIRTDLPRYRVWRRGELIDEPTRIDDLWRSDFVTFAVGCSFSFEEALSSADVPVRNVHEGRNVSMYRTSIPCQAAGRFHGPVVVSMRPMKPVQAVRAIQITSRFPSVHGAPIHFGDPQAIGIADLQRPDYGDPVSVESGEIPVFWACGVTPQAVIEAAGIEFVITHAPGAMLVTDVKNVDLAAM
jgi:uncharacterized protein YcsI (UPF0317 family)